MFKKFKSRERPIPAGERRDPHQTGHICPWTGKTHRS